MSNIKIAATSDQVQLDFSFQSQQVFSYVVQVLDDTGKVFFKDQGVWDGKKSFTLGKGSDLAGQYLSVDWAVIDPLGAGNNFSAEADASQLGAKCPASQTISGKSTATAVNKNTIAQFTT